MKKIILSATLFVALFTQVSCSSDSSSSGANSNDPILGWWYPKAGNTTVYRAYYFGADGSYIQDMTNFFPTMAVGQATWQWQDDSSATITPVQGSTIVGGTQTLNILLLTQDTLIAQGGALKLGRIDQNP